MTQPIFYKHFKKNFIYVLAILFLLEQIFTGFHHKFLHQTDQQNSLKTSVKNNLSTPINSNHHNSENDCFICSFLNFYQFFLPTLNSLSLFAGNILVLLFFLNCQILPNKKTIFIKSRAPPRLF